MYIHVQSSYRGGKMNSKDAIQSIAKKGVDKMSFVGLHNTEQGIIAFADSKATIEYWDGSLQEDKERQIHKMFYNNEFIFVTHGNNELFDVNHKVNMEDYVHENLKDNIEYQYFFDKLIENLFMYPPEYNNGIYHFIIGTKDENGYFLVKLEIDAINQDYEYSDKLYRKDAWFGGDERYINMYQLIPKYFDVPASQYIPMISVQLQSMIKIYDKDFKYNTVGLPIELHLFAK